MLKAVIVEDEASSRETLRNYIGKYCRGIEVAAEAGNVREGLEAIRKHRPHIVFLDVEMPYGNAFDLLENIDGEIDFETIFVTAYSDYAIQALNFSASYYILKPVDIEELVKAVDKIITSFAEKQEAVRTQVLIENMKIENKQLQKLALPLIDGFEVARLRDIVRCEAKDNFTEFYFADGSKRMICRTLKFYEGILKEYDFLRLHKSHLVNLQYIVRYKKGKGGQVIMNDGKAVDVAQNKKKELLEKFKK